MLSLSHVANQISSDDTYYAYEIRKVDKLIVINKYDFKNYEFLQMTSLRNIDIRSVKVKRFDFRIPIVKEIDFKEKLIKSLKKYYINENKTI